MIINGYVLKPEESITEDALIILRMGYEIGK